MFLRHFVPWPSADMLRKFYRDRPRETPPSGDLNSRGVTKYSDFGHIEGHISETVQDTRQVSVNRIWAFDWYQNRWPWMTLNGVVAVILRYFSNIGSIRGALRRSGWRYSFPNFLHQKCSPKILVFSDISLTIIWCREPFHRGIKRKGDSQI